MLAHRRRIGYVAGAPELTEQTVLVCSFSAAPVTVSCNGVSHVVSLSPIGTDNGLTPAGYYGHATFAGLMPATRYGITLRQNEITESDCGFWTNSPETQRCRFWYASCDNPPNEFGGYPGGGFTRIAKALRTAAHPHYGAFCDDIGYPSRQTVSDSILGIGHTGRAHDTGLAYDYALSYFNLLGMFEDTQDRNIRWGRDRDHVYCMRNMGWLFGIGDWEAWNDAGFDNEAATDPRFPVAMGVYDALFGPLRPKIDIRNRDTTARHWATTIGCMRIASADNVTNGTGNYADGTTLMAAQLGSYQIDDILDALNTDHPFKRLIINVGDRYLGPAATAHEFMSGQQHPLSNHCPSEYSHLYTETGNNPPSIMDNPKTNGTEGCFGADHGDTHRGGAFINEAPSYIGNAAESWMSWYLGTINGCVNFGLVTESAVNCVNGGGYGGTRVLYTQESGDTGHAKHRWHTLHYDIRGDFSTPELHVQLLDEAGRGPSAVFLPYSNMPALGSARLSV